MSEFPTMRTDLPPPSKPDRVFCVCGADPERHHLKTSMKHLADIARSFGYKNRIQESNQELVGRALFSQEQSIEMLNNDLKHLRLAAARDNEEITQVLGRALGYPWFKDDQKNFPGATEANGVCVGDHVAASLAVEAAKTIKAMRERLSILEIRAFGVPKPSGLRKSTWREF